MWIVRLALRRPYTFVVTSILLLILGPVAILRTPTDIFPNIDIPVISVLWNYTGLSPEEMSNRIVFQYERVLTTTVNNIEHIESQSLNGIGVVKIFFHPGVQIGDAVAQVTAVSQTLLRQLPPGTTPPLIIQYNASSVPILQLSLAGEGLSEQQLGDIGLNFVRTRPGQRSRRRDSISLRRQAAPGSGGPQYRGAAVERPFAQRRRQRHQHSRT